MPNLIPSRLYKKSTAKPRAPSSKSNDNAGAYLEVASRDEINASHEAPATHMAGIGNMERTQFEGVITPTQYKERAHLKTVVHTPIVAKAPTAKLQPRLSVNSRFSSGNKPAAGKGPSASDFPKYSSDQFRTTPHESRAPTSEPPPSSRRPPGSTVKPETFSPTYGMSISQYVSVPPPNQRQSTSTTRPQPPSSTSSKIRPSFPTHLPPKLVNKARPLQPQPQTLTSTFIKPKAKGKQHTPTSSHGPITTTSIYKTPNSQRMASLQPLITTLPPAARAKQESWAQSVITSLASNTCPEGNKFKRIDQSKSSKNAPSGYQCSGGRHFLSDALIAQGTAGIYLLLDPSDATYLAGPYFPSRNDPSTLLYSGEEPKRPPHAPDWVSGSYKGNFNAGTGEKEPVRIGKTVLGRARDRDILDIARGLGVVGLSAKKAREKCKAFVESKEK